MVHLSMAEFGKVARMLHQLGYYEVLVLCGRDECGCAEREVARILSFTLDEIHDRALYCRFFQETTVEGVLMSTRFPPEVLTEDEVRGLTRACSSRAPTGLRNAALIAVLYRAGLRVSEALDLRVKDFNPEAGTLRVLRTRWTSRQCC